MQQNHISSKTKVLALFGNPAKHSLSPLIQNRFLRDNSIDAVYVTFEFPPERFMSSFKGAMEMGMWGLNITMPYKEKAFEICDINDGLSTDTSSVNTVRFDRDGNNIKANGFNTDIDGFLKSLEKKGCILKDMTCLVIGAGGAARSAVFALLKVEVKKVYIYNRTLEKAENIKKVLGDRINIEVLKDIKDRAILKETDLICNCTPVGMETGRLKDLLPVPAGWDLGNKVVFETIYEPVETAFLKKAKREGAITIDGLDMLINQAASSFEKWFGIYPETAGIKEMLFKTKS